MSLVEQLKYIDNLGGNNEVQHDYMAAQINNIALALQEYTRVNYPSIYNSDPSYNSYLSMAYSGLDEISCYKDFLNSLPGNDDKEKKDNLAILKIQLYNASKCP